MADPLAYYAAPGVMTDPREHAPLFADLPRDLASLCKIVQGVLIHIFWAERYGVQLPDERKTEVQIRSVARKLTRILELDPRPLTEARSLDKKLVGNCRDFTVMLTALLQHQGVPARARCGFGRYFMPGKYEDHWVCEHWNAAEKRWGLVDAQLDEFQQQALQVRFSPLDVPRTMFITGGRAWQMCRAGQANPDKFGIFDMHGMWFIRGNVVRDLASLNKVELLPWDGWGLMGQDSELSADDLAFLDRVAELSQGDVSRFDAVRALYENDERLRVPAVIKSYTDRGVQSVAIADA